MGDFKDILNTVVIFLLFKSVIIFVFLMTKIKEVKENWPKYRCNPSVMPFAGMFGHDAASNFVFCLSNIQGGLMEFFLKPINGVIGILSYLGSGFLEDIQAMRGLINWLKKASSMFSINIFGILGSVMSQFQNMIIKVKDTMFKLIGLLMVLFNLVKSVSLVGKSTWNGPIGDVVKTFCFHPETKLILKNGKRINMKDINLGDVLENGSTVLGTLKVKGDPSNCFYKIFSKKLNDYIYVTGSHKILPDNKLDNSTLNNFIDVENYKKAEKTNNYEEELSCLITDDHLISIGEYTFWDWED